MTSSAHYVGYFDLETMISVTEECGTIFANCYVESSTTRLGSERRSTIIFVARIQGELVHYWRWKVAEVLMLNPDQPIDDDFARRSNIKAGTTWNKVREWLHGKGKVVEALVALHKDTQYLNGYYPAFMQQTKESSQNGLPEKSNV